MTVSNEAVEAARQALHRVRWERMERMLEGDRRAMGEREPGDPPDMQEDARAALEAAAKYMLPAPEGVSEAECRALIRELREPWALDDAPVPKTRNGSIGRAKRAANTIETLLSALSSERERAERAEQALEQFHEHKGWTANYVAQRLYDEKAAAERAIAR